jgi:hypothetical protein
VDLCSTCGKTIIQKDGMDHILEYLEQEGHDRGHLLLKVHFNNGYFKY